MDEISVIFTVWKRNNLEKQFMALEQQQGVSVKEVYVYQNESHVDLEPLKEQWQFTHIHCKNKNFKFHGRFTLPLLFDTEYTVIFDDDTIPNPHWLSHCLSLCKEKNCIVGANCRNYDRTGYDCGCGNTEHMKCDIVGHCWFFKTKWAHYMWREKPPTYDNGEDIHFCASCQIHGNIDTYFPSQPHDNPYVWGDTQTILGCDEHATWKKRGHDDQRWGIYDYWIKKGWRVKS